jgi:hypothetical protein
MRGLHNKSMAGPAVAETLALSTLGATLNSNLVSPVKGRLPEPVLDAKTQKKLFGKLSIADVALFGQSVGDSESGLIEGYQVDSKIRFNFHNRDFKVPPGKMNRYID